MNNKSQLNDTEIGQRIKSIRLNLGVNMEDFGKMFDPKASKGVVSNWENSYNKPNNKRIKEIAKMGNVSVDYLLHGSKNLNEELNTLMNSAAFAAEKKELTSLLEKIDFNEKDVKNLLIYLTLMETAKSNSEIEQIVKSFIEYLAYFIKSAENGSLNTKQIGELKDLFQGTYDLLIEEFEKQNSNS